MCGMSVQDGKFPAQHGAGQLQDNTDLCCMDSLTSMHGT
jgi:hypothetical protein